jgi:hypothetical protein
MGFTVDNDRKPLSEEGRELENAVSPKGGYLEVTSSASYSITISGN